MHETYPGTGGSAEPRLSIVIVTNNRVTRLINTLGRLSQLEAGYPIIVVDNASTDGTVATVRRHFPAVQIIERATNIGGVARNDGIEAASTDYIAFADDDSWYDAGSLATAVDILDRYPRLAVLMSRVYGPTGELDPCCGLMNRSPLPHDSSTPGIPILGFLACGATVRRDAVLDSGGFDSRHGTGGEEEWVSWNLAERGWELRYVPEITSHHHPAPRTPERMRQRRIERISIELWGAWSRRRRPAAIGITAHYLRRALTDAESRAGLFRALPDLPASLANRRPLSRRVEALIIMLERDRQEHEIPDASSQRSATLPATAPRRIP